MNDQKRENKFNSLDLKIITNLSYIFNDYFGKSF